MLKTAKKDRGTGENCGSGEKHVGEAVFGEGVGGSVVARRSWQGKQEDVGNGRVDE